LFKLYLITKEKFLAKFFFSRYTFFL